MNEIINLSKKELRNLQLIELEMLIEVDRICRKNNIKYSLDGGTLLGAIRHKGFIPWDDDLDVMFTHVEYEKFYKACKDDLDSNRFFFQDFRTDDNYRWGYGKLRRLNTEYIKRGQEKLKQKRGVCIDIFDYQNLSDEKKTRSRYKKKMFLLRKIMYAGVGKDEEKNLFFKAIYNLLNCISIKWVQETRLKEVNKYNEIDSKKMSCEMFPTPSKKDGVDRKIFENYIDVEFEGMQFMAVREYDMYLRISYGDYMQLPPPEKRKGVMNAIKYSLLPMDEEKLKMEYEENRKENRNG